MIKKTIAFGLPCLIAVFFVSTMNMQTEIPLYNGAIPNSRFHSDEETMAYAPGNILIVSRVSRPTLTVFLPPADKTTHIAVIICPGGGYVNLAMGYEGTDVAKRFNESGITAFVLKYRIPNDSTMIDKKIGPLQDAQRAFQILRSRAAEWGIDPHRIGIMGFSAGGHLASTAGTHFQKDYIPNPDHVSLRPDFMVLIYPVISFEKPFAHMGSASNLLGSQPRPEEIIAFSNEKQVTDQTAAAFLVHAKDDNVVPYENSLLFSDALKKHGVPVELYLYERGGHGFGMTNPTSPKAWMVPCISWIKSLYSK
jgi:acetyl esterase/lipase